MAALPQSPEPRLGGRSYLRALAYSSGESAPRLGSPTREMRSRDAQRARTQPTCARAWRRSRRRRASPAVGPPCRPSPTIFPAQPEFFFPRSQRRRGRGLTGSPAGDYNTGDSKLLTRASRAHEEPPAGRRRRGNFASRAAADDGVWPAAGWGCARGSPPSRRYAGGPRGCNYLVGCGEVQLFCLGCSGWV